MLVVVMSSPHTLNGSVGHEARCTSVWAFHEPINAASVLAGLLNTTPIPSPFGSVTSRLRHPESPRSRTDTAVPRIVVARALLGSEPYVAGFADMSAPLKT